MEEVKQEQQETKEEQPNNQEEQESNNSSNENIDNDIVIEKLKKYVDLKIDELLNTLNNKEELPIDESNNSEIEEW